MPRIPFKMHLFISPLGNSGTLFFIHTKSYSDILCLFLSHYCEWSVKKCICDFSKHFWKNLFKGHLHLSYIVESYRGKDVLFSETPLTPLQHQTRLFVLGENRLQMGFYSLKIGQNMPRLLAAFTISCPISKYSSMFLLFLSLAAKYWFST